MSIRTFEMFRSFDESGISGTGKVLQGAIFGDGMCVVRWCTSTNENSIEIWQNYKSFLQIHVVSHPKNKTRIEFADSVVEEY